MTWFMHSKHLGLFAICIWATALAANPASAQQPSSAAINGTFIMSGGNVGPDLAEIVARGETHTWTLTLQGLSYSYDYELLNYENPENYSDRYITRVYATGFDFQFQGPDAAALNAIVSDGLMNGGLPDRPFVELRNYTYFDEDWDWLVQGLDWVIGITPIDYQQGFSFVTLPNILDYPFTVDANRYPVLEPFTCSDAWAFISDSRPGYGGSIGQYGGNTVSVSSVGFSMPGDYDNDGVVDGRDFLAWQRNPSIGNLAHWEANYGLPLSANSSAVPEPGSVILALGALSVGLSRHRR